MATSMETRKFNVGDLVEANNNCSGAVEGKKYRLVMDDGNLTLDGTNCSCQFGWKLISKSKSKSKKFIVKNVRFILKYDLETDPVEEFETLTQVEKRIRELHEAYGANMTNVTVYEVKNRKNISIEQTVTIKGL